MDKKGLSFKQCVGLIIITLAGIWLINNTSTFAGFISNVFTILFPFILGGCLAFILNIPMSFFERKLKKMKNKKTLRMLSLIFAILVIILVLTLVITLIVPRLMEVIQLLIDNIPYYTEQINNFLEQSEINFSLSDIDMSKLDTESLKSQILEGLPSLLTSSVSLVSNIVSGISSFVIAVIFAIYILIDKEKLQRQVTKLMDSYMSKKIADKIKNIATVANNVFRKFFTVQCLEATILGSLCIIGMLILRIPYAVPIGVLVGVTALIPVVGAFIGMIVGAILIVSVSPIKVVYFVIFVLILQQIEGNFIYPRVVGSSVGLPGMWVLFAVTVGGSIGGILGMLLGVPIATTIYNLLKQDTNKKLSNKIELEKKEGKNYE